MKDLVKPDVFGTNRSPLDDFDAKLQTAGRLHPGIMVLTKASLGDQTEITVGKKKTTRSAYAQHLYQRSIDGGAGYQESVKVIQEKCGFKKSPMIPVNVPYFSVRGREFSNPAIADSIFEKYAEVRQDIEPDTPRLYRIPIILPFDNWLTVFPNDFTTYKAGKRTYWSEYDQSGEKRFCLTYPTEPDGRARAWGGRKPMLRRENDGICDPNICPQYQAGECKLKARLLFYVYQIPGAALIDMPTTSLYGMSAIRSSMLMMQAIHGRISGVFRSEPKFYLIKTLDRVSRVVNGKQTLVTQWIPKLETATDMTQMFVEQEQAEALGQQAQALLEDPGAQERVIVPGDEPAPVPHTESPQDDAPMFWGEEVLERETGEIKARAVEEKVVNKQDTDLEDKVLKGLEIIGVSFAQFSAYAETIWGKDWADKPEVIQKAYEQISTSIDSGKADAFKELVLAVKKEGGK